MVDRFDIVFWQNAASIHQAPLMRALTTSLKLRVLVVVPEGVSAKRKAMGWLEPDYGSALLLYSDKSENRKRIVSENRDATAHIFSGLGVYRAVDDAFFELTGGEHGHISVMCESWRPGGLAGVVRRERFRLRLASRKRHIDTLFVSGELARRQFEGLGFEASEIADFGYFVDAPTSGSSVLYENGILRCLYVGELSERKDPLTLIRALGQCSSTAWRLALYGDGPLAGECRALVRKLGLEGRVDFRGQVSNEEVRMEMRLSDLLVLPSKHDGWGAVVNEALMSGTPVLVSQECGASSLVGAEAQGQVFEAGDVAKLTSILEQRLRLGSVTEDSRRTLVDWAREHISPDVAGEYLWARVKGGAVRPPPWKM